MTCWLAGQAGLNALRSAAPGLAARFFNRGTSFVIGAPPAGWRTQQVASFTSYATYAQAGSPLHWVLYDPEMWDATPLIEQQHPAAFISAFASLAHARGQQVIAAPARDLMGVPGADYGTQTAGETADAAFLSAGIPAACSAADVYHCQAQALQPDPAAYMALLDGAAGQLPAGFPVWAGLTTLRGHDPADIVTCYSAAQPAAGGFWLNTNAATIDAAVSVLAAIGTP